MKPLFLTASLLVLSLNQANACSTVDGDLAYVGKPDEMCEKVDKEIAEEIRKNGTECNLQQIRMRDWELSIGKSKYRGTYDEMKDIALARGCEGFDQDE